MKDNKLFAVLMAALIFFMFACAKKQEPRIGDFGNLFAKKARTIMLTPKKNEAEPPTWLRDILPKKDTTDYNYGLLPKKTDEEYYEAYRQKIEDKREFEAKAMPFEDEWLYTLELTDGENAGKTALVDKNGTEILITEYEIRIIYEALTNAPMAIALERPLDGQDEIDWVYYEESDLYGLFCESALYALNGELLIDWDECIYSTCVGENILRTPYLTEYDYYYEDENYKSELINFNTEEVIIDNANYCWVLSNGFMVTNGYKKNSRMRIYTPDFKLHKSFDGLNYNWDITQHGKYFIVYEYLNSVNYDDREHNYTEFGPKESYILDENFNIVHRLKNKKIYPSYIMGNTYLVGTNVERNENVLLDLETLKPVQELIDLGFTNGRVPAYCTGNRAVKQYTVNGGARFSIINVNGEVELEGDGFLQYVFNSPDHLTAKYFYVNNADGLSIYKNTGTLIETIKADGNETQYTFYGQDYNINFEKYFVLAEDKSTGKYSIYANRHYNATYRREYDNIYISSASPYLIAKKNLPDGLGSISEVLDPYGGRLCVINKDIDVLDSYGGCFVVDHNGQQYLINQNGQLLYPKYS